jgi:hypothetical protein
MPLMLTRSSRSWPARFFSFFCLRQAGSVGRTFVSLVEWSRSKIGIVLTVVLNECNYTTCSVACSSKLSVGQHHSISIRGQAARVRKGLVCRALSPCIVQQGVRSVFLASIYTSNLAIENDFMRFYTEHSRARCCTKQRQKCGVGHHSLYTYEGDGEA